jgi:hypothetical protein
MKGLSPRARTLALIAAGLVACNVAAALGIALLDASQRPLAEPRSALLGAAIEVFQPTEAIEDPTGSLNGPDRPRTWVTRAWAHWDAGWYASIAKDGYSYTPGEQSSVAFFPAYPLAIRALTALGLNRFVAGVLLTMLFGCAGLFVFDRWAAHLADEDTALRATALVVVYPFAFFLFGAMYSDAMYLCAAAGAFYALERDRLGVTVLLGAIACAARPVGPALVIGLLARRIELRATAGERIGARDLVPALAGAGLAAYMLFLRARFDDPLAFARAQAAWSNLAGSQSMLKFRFFELVAQSPTDFGTFLKALHGLIAISALACAIPIWRRLSKGYAVYVAVAMAMPLISSKDFMGLGRYAIAAFPVFLMLAQLLAPRPRLRLAYTIASALAFFFLSLAFAADNQLA